MTEKLERKLVEFTLDDFAKAEYYCWKADRDLQVAEEKYEYLKEHGKDLLASLMTEIKSKCREKTSETELERLARSTGTWEEHRTGEHAARDERNKAKFKSRAADRYWSTIQSGLSYLRAELAKVGSQPT